MCHICTVEEYMSQEAVEQFLGRLLTDDSFRKRAEHSVETACAEGGFILNSGELRSIHYEDIIRLKNVATHLDANVKRYSR
jgi:hypothetical protein